MSVSAIMLCVALLVANESAIVVVTTRSFVIGYLAFIVFTTALVSCLVSAWIWLHSENVEATCQLMRMLLLLEAHAC